MRKIIYLIISVILLISLCSCKKNYEKFTAYYFDYFDTHTTIVGYEADQEEFDAVCEEIKALLGEYHKLYTIYTRYEGVNNLLSINNSSEPIEVDEKIIEMLEYAKEMYALTDGNMNVAMGSVLSIWHSYRDDGLDDPKNASLPPMKELRNASQHTDINDIVIDSELNTVFLADPEMSLDVGAIAKGYAVEKVALWLEEQGKTGYILNVGGNIRTIGSRPDGTPWSAGIENPDNSVREETPYIAYLHLSGESLVTSGVYQRFYTVNGINYHHIIDPETLMPGERYMSVSVLCKSSALADALSTALFNMDLDEGIELVEKLDGVEAMWVHNDGEISYSSGFESYCFEYKE